MDLSNAEWRKSTRSQGASANCIEVASNLPGIVGVRDSKNPSGPALIFSPSEWSAFIGEIKNGTLA